MWFHVGHGKSRPDWLRSGSSAEGGDDKIEVLPSVFELNGGVGVVREGFEPEVFDGFGGEHVPFLGFAGVLHNIAVVVRGFGGDHGLVADFVSGV